MYVHSLSSCGRSLHSSIYVLYTSRLPPCRPVGWLDDWLAGWMIGWLAGWRAAWLYGMELMEWSRQHCPKGGNKKKNSGWYIDLGHFSLSMHKGSRIARSDWAYMLQYFKACLQPFGGPHVPGG